MKNARLVLLALALIHSGHVWAEGLHNSDLLKLSEEQRRWWYAGAVTTVGHMVFLYDEEKAQCVWNWYFNDPERRNAQLLKSFQKYPDHTPSGVILALLKRECGDLLPASAKPKQ